MNVNQLLYILYQLVMAQRSEEKQLQGASCEFSGLYIYALGILDNDAKVKRVELKLARNGSCSHASGDRGI